MLKKDYSNFIECNGDFYENISKSKKERTIEGFTSLLGALGIKGGNETNIKDSKEINKKAELDTNIDRSTVVNACNKIVNNVANEVAQSNSAEVNNSIGASNSALFMGIECDSFKLDGLDQNSDTSTSTSADIVQKTQSTISNSMTNVISKKVTASLPKNEDEIMNKQNKMLKQFMDATPGLDPDAAKKIVGGLSDDGFGNKNNVSTDYKLNAELKNKLNLNNSFKVDDNNEIRNEIKNSLNQDNFARCSSNAMASNNLTVTDVKCKTALLTNIKQKAVAKSILNCSFDQKAQSSITNKVMTRITSVFENIQNVLPKDPETQRRIAALALAVGENIINTADNIKGDKKDDKKENKKR